MKLRCSSLSSSSCSSPVARQETRLAMEKGEYEVQGIHSKQCKPNDSVTMETQPLGPPLWFTGNEMSLSGVSQLHRNFAVTLPACPAQVTPLEPLMPPVLESSDFSATPCCRDPSWGATRHSNNLCGIPPDEWTLLQSVLPQKRGTVRSHCSSQSLTKVDIGPR